MLNKEYLKIYNEIFYSDLPNIEFLIKNKGFNLECVEFICNHLNFMVTRCEESAKSLSGWLHFKEYLEIKKLIKQKETETDETVLTQIDLKIENLKKVFDVSNDESVVESKKLLKRFLILRKELVAINQIKNSLVDNVEQCSWEETLSLLKNNRKLNLTEAYSLANKIVGTYFYNMGLTQKPNIILGEEYNAKLYDVNNETNKLGLVINKNDLLNLQTSTNKLNFAKTLVNQCAYAYSQVLLTNTKNFKGKTSQYAMFGINLIDRDVLGIEPGKDINEFTETQVENVFSKRKHNVMFFPCARFADLLLSNYIGDNAMQFVRKEINKKK